jgi:general secretion pathway protein D
MNKRRFLTMMPLAALIGCELPHETTRLTPLPPVGFDAGAAGARVNGPAGSDAGQPRPEVSVVDGSRVALHAPAAASGRGEVSLDFADTDIRDVVAQILGSMLGQNYTIDPAVHGTATLRTTAPIARDQLLPTLQTLLAQNGATLVQSGGITRVIPLAAAATSPGLASTGADSGTSVVPLHFASAEDLAKTLQPYVQGGGRIVADIGRNTLLISGDPGTRQTLTSLVSAFDIDLLAGQSYALLPVSQGGAKDFASAMQDALHGQGNALSNLVRVVPMPRINSVLLVSSQPHYIEDARRLFRLVERSRLQNVRSWHVYYLQNSRSNDTAYVLQQAFTPNNVTAQPTPSGAGRLSGINSQQAGGFGGSSTPGSSVGGGVGTSPGGTSIGGSTGGGIGSGLGGGGSPAPAAAAPAAAPATPAAGNPLLGGLDSPDGGQTTDAMRIIPNTQNNAILIFATPHENDTVETMLRKLDILPLQVRIDATIAEVDLNDNLQYGTQFFFSAGLQGALSFGASAGSFASGFPGFVLSGPGSTGAALSALQAVTKVRVLSSPQLLVLDNEAARLEVGALVPYLSQTAQSTITSDAPIVSSVSYQQTGVIMQVTPRVNGGGLVTLDISQEVSSVANGVTTPGVNSPTFNQRDVTSRVVIQDGQTVGLAGLISDNDSRENQGIPWLKDVPILGLLAGQQTNQRQRQELLVLITPHVVHDQRDARALTEDLREELNSSAGVPQELTNLPASGSADPGRPLRRRLRLEQ